MSKRTMKKSHLPLRPPWPRKMWPKVITEGDGRRLVAYLETKIRVVTNKTGGVGVRGCAGHRLTKRWLKANGFHIPSSLEILAERGGFCDCEVVFNVFPERRR